MKMPRDKDDGMRMIMTKKKATKKGGHGQLSCKTIKVIIAEETDPKLANHGGLYRILQ